jgi:hypothetical protein
MRYWRVGWLLFAVLLVGTAQAGGDWPQWGGPDRDFTVGAQELSRSWGENGPSAAASRRSSATSPASWRSTYRAVPRPTFPYLETK